MGACMQDSGLTAVHETRRSFIRVRWSESAFRRRCCILPEHSCDVGWAVALPFNTTHGSTNKAVLITGIYYPVGSLKSKLCIRGRDLLYDRCAALDIRYKKTGKVSRRSVSSPTEKKFLCPNRDCLRLPDRVMAE